MTCDVLIGIQARSTSTRLPNKGFAMVGSSTITEKIISTAVNSANFIKKDRDFGASVRVALLIPSGDPLKIYSSMVDVIEGPEDDVLSRYYAAFAKYNPKYMVRITGDCPALHPFMISKAINTIRAKQADYVCNCGEEWRTSADGYDVEAMSARVFLWLHENAETKEEREHVTISLRTRPPAWAVTGAIIHQIDNSDLKISVDNQEDLARVRERDARYQQKVKVARMKHNFVVYL